MIKIKVTYNVKPKETKELEVSSFEQLKQKIYEEFKVQEGKINFMKPRLKDQDGFKKDVKEGTELTIVGTKRKQKERTEEDIERERLKQEQIKRMKEQLKLNPHQRIIRRLNQRKIKQRGIQFFNAESNQPEDLGVDYALCPLYLLKHAKEFKDYCTSYTCMQKNPDGLIIEELGNMFKEMQKSQGVICPLNWISSWICYCSDDIEYPYPTYGVDYFLNRLFSTMKMAFDVELEKKEEEPNSRVDTGTKFFGIQMLTRRQDITRLDEEDEEEDKQIEKKAIKFFLECDLGRPEFKSVMHGVRQRFKEKDLWRNFYAFDIQYRESIIFIERLPKYLMVQCSRWGYKNAREQWQQVQFNEGPKSYHQVRINRVLDLYDCCDANLKDKLDQGRYERDQMFYPYHMDERFPKYQESVKYGDQLAEPEMNYQYLDHILFSRDIYHQFWFQPLKNSKPTGEFRLVGVVLQKGHYYHRPNKEHEHDCRGKFMTFMYRRGKEWLRYNGAEVDIVDIQEATNPKYWGQEGEWTPMLLMYQEINMRNIQVQPPSEPRRDRTRTHRRGGGG